MPDLVWTDPGVSSVTFVLDLLSSPPQPGRSVLYGGGCAGSPSRHRQHASRLQMKESDDQNCYLCCHPTHRLRAEQIGDIVLILIAVTSRVGVIH